MSAKSRGRRESRVQSDASTKALSAPRTPEPLTDAKQTEQFTLKDLPDKKSLANVLANYGLDTSTWGSGDTKDVGKFWKEIKLDEAALEVWKTRQGESLAVRVTHVLRAKVCSPESFERNVYLFNTWQQYGDGRKRTRNGLLSEKLTISEMPLEDNLMAVCERAVTEEEMQRVVDSKIRIGPGSPAPEYDPSVKCPLQVVNSIFVEHTIEIEKSKSYPGLLTMYHLYTVDIICKGLPIVDFNTLEFDHEDDSGRRNLKYIHAWVWLDWGQIQRYLFEGSELKQRQTKGSFDDAEKLRNWLEQFDLDLESWGKNGFRSVNDLFNEVEREETHLELWGRHDGVPLLMRVVHVIQIIVCSTDSPGLVGKHLLQIWSSTPEGQVRSVNRLLAKKLSTRVLPFDEKRFGEAAIEAVNEQLQIGSDPLMAPNLERCTTKEEALRTTPCSLIIGDVTFLDRRYDLEESPTYTGMHTMYHLYTVQVTVKGLPDKDFTSFDFDRAKLTGKDRPYSLGWRWVSWMEAMDLVHKKVGSLERQEGQRTKIVKRGVEKLGELKDRMKSVGSDDRELKTLVSELTETLTDLQAPVNGGDLLSLLPPSMVSKLSEQTLYSQPSSMAGHLEHARSMLLPGVEPSDKMNRAVIEEDTNVGPRLVSETLPPGGPEKASWETWSPWCSCRHPPTAPAGGKAA